MEVTKQLLARDIVSMVPSGNQGGNPVISKQGISTKAGNMAFTTIGSQRPQPPTHDFGNVDIDKVPMDVIKEKIKLTLMGIDKNVVQLYIDQQWEEQSRLRKLAKEQEQLKLQKLNNAGYLLSGTVEFQNESRDQKNARVKATALD